MEISDIRKLKGDKFMTQITLDWTDDKISIDVDKYIYLRGAGFSRKELKKHYGN